MELGTCLQGLAIPANRAHNVCVSSDLDNSPQYVKGVGPRRAELLERLGVRTVRDLLMLFPRDYQDRTHIVPVAELKPGMTATVKGEIVRSRVRQLKFWKKLLTVNVTDATGTLEAVWFNQAYLEPEFAEGGVAYLTGKVTERKGHLQMTNPEHEVIPPFDADEEDAGGPEFLGIVPVYPLTEGLRQAAMRRILRNALDAHAALLDEIIPTALLISRGLPGVREALEDVHFPKSFEAKDLARRRFVYEEFLALECAMALRRASIEKEPCPYPVRVTDEIDRRIRARVQFTLTADQEKVIREITADLAKPHPMNRLLQGDVGSGKTVVALYAMLSAVANKYQVAMMAPTEILATQHYETFRGLLEGSRVRLELLVGGLSAAGRRDARARVAEGKADIVFGTHALIEEDVEFRNLALLVVDEQHKFGVVQRAQLREKGRHPHCLVMTATPIPRTLMLTVFGDLDTSTIEHLPPGRRPIKTSRAAPGQIGKVFDLIRKEVAAGRQAYVVYPLVEEKGTVPASWGLSPFRRQGMGTGTFSGSPEKEPVPIQDLKAATEMHKRLSTGEFSELRVGLLTGRMKPAEKDRIMRDFRDRKLDVLVATVVVEVGLDVPNATVMVVENAERFGLSQLHQLRGRIGRSAFQSYCIAVAAPRTDEAKSRLKVFEECSDGFRLAEEDLRLRGPGEFFGTRQHGVPELKIGNIVTDYDLLRLSADDARQLVAGDERLRAIGLAPLRREVLSRFGKTLELVDVG